MSRTSASDRDRARRPLARSLEDSIRAERRETQAAKKLLGGVRAMLMDPKDTELVGFRREAEALITE